MSGISTVQTTNPKQKPLPGQPLGFGNLFTDHMFIMDYCARQGWHSPRIVPYAPIELDPAAVCLHYGQTVFEGLKAYRTADGHISLFRPQENIRRINRSSDRLCMPVLDEELALEALKQLITLEKDWVPDSDGASLYVRPFLIATQATLGVHASTNYSFIIILSPSGSYYAEGLAPVKIYIENTYVRTVRGGTGTAKTGGNYAAALKAQKEAEASGYSQVLWLDGVERKYVEEVGAMNVFFVIDDEIITPMLSGSILEGITRKSALHMLRDWGMKVTERLVSVEELKEAGKAGRIKEMFGTGTAAVISPVSHLKCGEDVIVANNGEIGPISQKLYDTLTDIQYKRSADPYGWVVDVCKA